MNSNIQALLKVARAEVGYLEKKSNSQLDDKTANAGRNNFTKYARDLDAIPNFYNGKKQGVYWCDVFVDWCFVQAFGVETAKKLLGQPDKSSGAGCVFSVRYFKAMGRFHKNPEPGDQIFFSDSSGDAGHTGIVYKVDSQNVYTVEGNTSGASGVVDNGGCVREKSYSLTYPRIYGYGRPDYTRILGDVSVENTENTPEYKVGDVVEFTGVIHYASTNASTGPKVKASKAKITAISKNGKHPYHLRAVNEKGAFVSGGVYGWVDIADISPIKQEEPEKSVDPEVPVVAPTATAVSVKLSVLCKGDKDTAKGGNKGTQVSALQCLLKGRGCNIGQSDIDGCFGPDTETAVMYYQKKNGLKVDGKVGPETWNDLLGV